MHGTVKWNGGGPDRGNGIFGKILGIATVSNMLNKNTWGVKKCGANQKQHCKQAGAAKTFDIS